MAKRKKNSGVGKRRRKALQARAAEKKRRKAALAGASGEATADLGAQKADASEAVTEERVTVDTAAPDACGAEGRARKRESGPMGTIKHGYSGSFVSRRESPRTDSGISESVSADPTEDALGRMELDTEADAFLYENYSERERMAELSTDPLIGMPMPAPEMASSVISDMGTGDGIESLIARQIELDRKLTEGNDALRYTRLCSSKDRYSDIGSLPDFTSVIDRNEIKGERRRIIRNDLDATLLGFEYRSTLLKNELSASSRLLVNRAYGTDGKDSGRVRRRVRRLGRNARYAVKLAKSDNSRYYGALLDGYARLSSDTAHDKVRINALVTELYELIARRDAVNRRLIALYSGGARRGVGTGEREAARMAAVRREQKKYERLYKDLLDARIELRARDRLLEQIDKQAARAGEIAESKYALAHTRPSRSERKALGRFLHARKEEYKRCRAQIAHRARALIRKSRNRQRANLAAILGWVALGLLAVIAGIVLGRWDAIWAFLSENVINVNVVWR